MKIKVAKVIDEWSLVLNKGAKDGIEIGQRFLIYAVGEVIKDPDTGDELEALEIVKGTGKVTHLQENIATISSDMKSSPHRTIRRIKKKNALNALAMMLGPEEIEETLPAEKIPFDGAEVGDIAKTV